MLLRRFTRPPRPQPFWIVPLNNSRTFSSSSIKCAKPYYVTTPIFYPNAAPHIGHLYTLVAADIFARHARLSSGEPIRFLTGTDEHGLKIQKAAQAQGLEPLEFCNKLSVRFNDLANKAGASYTRFIRTSEQDHRDTVQYLWRALDSQGLIYKGHHRGWYSVSDECFYTNGQVRRIRVPIKFKDGSSERTPGKRIPTKRVIISKETGSVVEWAEERNYMFRLSRFREFLLERYQSNPDVLHPPQQRTFILDMLSKPLADLSISRPRSRLHWGIAVPDDPEHTVYVWFDALTNYLTGVGYPWNGEEQGAKVYWPPDLQVVGKDIVRFHAIYFPAMLQALGLPLPKRLLAHSHWTVNRRKMSKSVGNVIDPFIAIDELGVDLVRYYLARVGGRFRDDVDWSGEQLEKHAAELQSLLGNFYLRVTSTAIRKRLHKDLHSNLRPLLEQSLETDKLKEAATPLQTLASVVDGHVKELNLADALEAIVHQLKAANVMLNLTEPWAKSTPQALIEKVYALSLETLRICGILLQPYIPAKAGELLDVMGVPPSERSLSHGEYLCGTIGEVMPGVKLFSRPSKHVD
ncbi:tRNA synthetases class I (M)-domain-containing protein [Gloeopeniophorella convolvens]|nr:tRNA synthetases class I (M)-domain-containing protein [Gloeopeniophorella convolvens]